MMHVREACLVAIALLLAWLIWYTVWESYGDDGIDLMLGYVTAAIWSMAVRGRLVREALS
jgi:hypothetical protein